MVFSSHVNLNFVSPFLPGCNGSMIVSNTNYEKKILQNDPSIYSHLQQSHLQPILIISILHICSNGGEVESS